MDVILHLTQDCQLSCSYCYGGPKQSRSMSFDTAARAIDLLFAQPAPDDPPKLTFFGGEPLLELPLLKRCVEYAEAKRDQTGWPLRFEVATNGVAVDDELVAYFHEKGMEPTLSFDGVAPAQDACRRFSDGSSSFAAAERALHRLLPSFPNLPVCAVVSPENVRYLTETWAGPELMDTSIAWTVIQDRGARDAKAQGVHERVQAGGGEAGRTRGGAGGAGGPRS